MSEPHAGGEQEGSRREDLSSLHLRFGWWALLGFLSLGIALEAFHGLKVAFYLDVSNETRRLLWTLAHAHGVLLSIVNLAFAACLRSFPIATPSLGAASRSLLGATLLLPGGFFLGGVWVFGGDPGPGIALVPLGAALLFYAVWSIARAASDVR